MLAMGVFGGSLLDRCVMEAAASSIAAVLLSILDSWTATHTTRRKKVQYVFSVVTRGIRTEAAYGPSCVHHSLMPRVFIFL